MAGTKHTMDLDPDYGFETNEDEDVQAKRARIMEESARDAAVEKIQTIIDDQFSKEIEAKETELMTINQRLAQARCVMDRLRACAIASFYAASFTKPVDGAKGPDAGAAYHPAIQNVLRKAVTTVMSKNAPPFQQKQTNNMSTSLAHKQTEEIQDPDQTGKADSDIEESALHNEQDTTVPMDASNSKMKVTDQAKPKEDRKLASDNAEKVSRNLGGRQRIKKTIVVGNVSKYIPPEQREGSDKSTHKWMVYVRGEKNEPGIDHFVRKVWFFLHPSYRPNDLVEVCESPFHLTRRGWGEFPIRVQLHFCDRRNRPVDIIHHLRLDRSYTGLQTLGAETVCEVEIDQSSVQLSVDEILEVANLSTLPEDNIQLPDIKLTDLSQRVDLLSDKKETKNEKVIEEKKEKSHVSAEESVQEVGPEVKYSDQHEFQPVTTSCTISSDTVSPSRKGVIESKDGKNATSSKSEDDGTEVRSENPQNLEEEMEVDEKEKEKDEEIREDNEEEEEKEMDAEIHPPGKKRRKRRRDSCRASASEDEVPSDQDPQKMSSDSQKIKELDLELEDLPKAPEDRNNVSSTNASPKEDIILLENTPEGSDTVMIAPDKSAIAHTVIKEKPLPDVAANNITTLPEESAIDPSPKMPVDEKIPVKQEEETIKTLEKDGKTTNLESKDTSNDAQKEKLSSPKVTWLKSPSITTAQKIVILNKSADSTSTDSSSLSVLKSKPPVILLPKSSIAGKGSVRIRSASDGGLQRDISGSCASLMRSGLTVTPVLNVKVQTDHSARSTETPQSTFTSPLKKLIPCPGVQKYIVLDGKPLLLSPPDPNSQHGKAKIAKSKTVVVSQAQLNTSSKFSSPSTSKQAIPLSCLLSPGDNPPQNILGKKAHMLTLTQSPKGSYISLKATNVPVTKEPLLQPRQKRSFSADQLPRQNISLVPASLMNVKPKPGSSQTSPVQQTVQLHIMSPPAPQKSGKLTTTKMPPSQILIQRKSKPIAPQGVIFLDAAGKVKTTSSSTASSTISLQALQTAIASGNMSLSSPVQIKTEKQPDSETVVRNVTHSEITGQQQYVLATVVNPKGKKQLALINPATLSFGSQKKTTSSSIPFGISRKNVTIPPPVKQTPISKISMKNLKDLSGDKKLPQQDALALLNKLLPEPVYKVIGESICLENLTSIDEALPLVVKHVPLVNEKRNLTEFPFCAKSEADFLEWNIGKQRAAEWQRAILVRRVLKYLQNKSKKLQTCKLPSKKFIMNWCLRHGYSVFTDEYEETEDNGSPVKKEENLPKNIPPTSSSSVTILKTLEEKLTEKLRNKKAMNIDSGDVIDVDVVTVDSPKKYRQTNLQIKEEPAEISDMETEVDYSTDITEEMKKMDTLKFSKEVEVVKEMTREIGIDISTQQEEPVCSMVLAKAMQQFVGHLLRSSLAASLIRRDGPTSMQRVAPEEIQVVDVMTAVKGIDSFDFITDKNMASGGHLENQKQMKDPATSSS